MASAAPLFPLRRKCSCSCSCSHGHGTRRTHTGLRGYIFYTRGRAHTREAGKAALSRRRLPGGAYAVRYALRSTLPVSGRALRPAELIEPGRNESVRQVRRSNGR